MLQSTNIHFYGKNITNSSMIILRVIHYDNIYSKTRL